MSWMIVNYALNRVGLNYHVGVTQILHVLDDFILLACQTSLLV